MSYSHGVKSPSASTDRDGNDQTESSGSSPVSKPQRADEGLLEEMLWKKVDGIDLTHSS